MIKTVLVINLWRSKYSRFVRILTHGVLFVFFCACGQNENSIIKYGISDFQHHFEMEGNPLLSDHYFHRPYRFLLNDSLIFINDIANDSVQLHIIHRSTKEVRSLIPKGEGPGEFIAIKAMFLTNEGYLWLIESQGSNFIKLDIMAFWNNTHYAIEKGKLESYISKTNDTKNERISALIQVIPYRDSLLICSRFGEDSLLFETRTNGFDNLVTKFGHFPQLIGNKQQLLDNSIPDRIKWLKTVFNVYANIFFPFMSINQSRNELLVVFPAANLFDTYDLETFYLKKRIVGPKGKYPVRVQYINESGFPENDAIAGYHDVTVGVNYNYLLYSGKKFRNTDSHLCNFIHVYTSGGEPFAILALDRMVTAIHYDFKSNKIFALSEEDSNPLVWYQLPKGIH